MSCAEARDIDLVEYLSFLGYKPTRIRQNDYWYLSPLRDEWNASFKVNRSLNTWYDFGAGKGGDLIAFGTSYHDCNVSGFLDRLKDVPDSLRRQHPAQTMGLNLHGKRSGNRMHLDSPAAGSKKIRIVSISTIKDYSLCGYLYKRRISLALARVYCKEVLLIINNTKYRAIGFRNRAGGYELRNGFLKVSSSPKDITLIGNDFGERVLVFEGFFSFLSFMVFSKDPGNHGTSYLILNSIAFFERSRLLLETFSSIHLYLDRDRAGLEITRRALSINNRYADKSGLYRGYKDLNDFLAGRKMIGENPSRWR